MLEFSVRKALETESGQIRELIDLVGINPTGLDWRRFLVAVNVGNMVIGCGQIKPHGDVRELASIAVSPEYRRQGVARALVENLLKNSSRPLYLMCMSHNGPLYGKFGFRSVAQDQMPRYFQRIHKLFKLANMVRQSGEDLLVMKLE